MMDGVRITPLRGVNDTPRGRNTWEIKGELLLPGHQDNQPVKQVSVYLRRNENFGEHSHRGDDPSKNPENLFLLYGEIEATFRNRRGETLTTKIQAPAQIVIEPYVLHFMKALGDVLMIEIRITPFDPAHPDTYSTE